MKVIIILLLFIPLCLQAQYITDGDDFRIIKIFDKIRSQKANHQIPDTDLVTNLQELLKTHQLYNGPTTGDFDSLTSQVMYKFDHSFDEAQAAAEEQLLFAKVNEQQLVEDSTQQIKPQSTKPIVMASVTPTDTTISVSDTPIIKTKNVIKAKSITTNGTNYGLLSTDNRIDMILVAVNKRIKAVETKIELRMNEVETRLNRIAAKYGMVINTSGLVAGKPTHLLPYNFGQPANDEGFWVGEYKVPYLVPDYETFDYPLNTIGDIKAFIVWEATKNGFPPELALAIADAESSFRPDAESETTAIGVFQFVIRTWRRTMRRMGRFEYIGLRYRYNPRLNIEAAIWLLVRGEFYHWEKYSGSSWKYLKNRYYK